MTTRRFLQLDVFSARPGSGNPLAVVLDAQGLDDAAMQSIARWTKLPETTFVFPAESAHSSYRLRMFSPQKEVPFAGHPSVGTAHAALEAGLAAPIDGVLVQDGIAGQLPLRVEQRNGHRSIAIRTPRARCPAGARRRPAPAQCAAQLAVRHVAACADGRWPHMVGGGAGQRGRVAQPAAGLGRDRCIGRIHRQHGRLCLCPRRRSGRLRSGGARVRRQRPALRTRHPARPMQCSPHGWTVVTRYPAPTPAMW